MGLGLVVLAIAGIGSCSLLVFNAARGPIDGANAWVALLDNGDFDGAYNNLCASLRASSDPQETIAQLTRRFGAGDGITDYNFSSVSVENGVTTVEGSISVAGQARPVVLLMQNENDSWKVCTIPA